MSNFGTATSAYGGAIFNRGTLMATDITFTNNQAKIGAVAYTGPFPEGQSPDIVAGASGDGGDSSGGDGQRLLSVFDSFETREEAGPRSKAVVAAAAAMRGLRGTSRPPTLAASRVPLAAPANPDGSGAADEAEDVNSVTRRRRQRLGADWGGKIFVQGDKCRSSSSILPDGGDANTTVAAFYATADSAAYLFCSPTCDLAGNGFVAISTTCAPSAAPTTAGNDVPTLSPSAPTDDDGDGNGGGSSKSAQSAPWFGLDLQTWMDIAVVGFLVSLLACVCAGRCRFCCGSKRKGCCCWRCGSGKDVHGNRGPRNLGSTSHPETSGTLDYFALPSSAAAANARNENTNMLDALYKHFGVLDHSGHGFDAGRWKKSPATSSNGHSLQSGHGGGERRSFAEPSPNGTTGIPRVSSYGYHDALGSESGGERSPSTLSSSLRASQGPVDAVGAAAPPDPTAATIRARLPARRHSWSSSADWPPSSPRPGAYPVEGAFAAAAAASRADGSDGVARTPPHRNQDRSVSAAAPSSYGNRISNNGGSSRSKRARTPSSSAASSEPSSLLHAALGSMDAQAADWVVNLEQLELGPMIGVGSSAHVFAARYFGQVGF